MQILKWPEEFIIGHPELDDQHRELIQIKDGLYQSILSGKNNECEILIDLFDYIARHFTYEEELFEQHNYPKQKEHKEQHKTFISGLNEPFTKVCPSDCKNNSGLGELMTELHDWLRDHMLVEDKDFAIYMNVRKSKQNKN